MSDGSDGGDRRSPAAIAKSLLSSQVVGASSSKDDSQDRTLDENSAGAQSGIQERMLASEASTYTSISNSCPHCQATILQPGVALFCQSCNMFLLRFRLLYALLSVSWFFFAVYFHLHSESFLPSLLTGTVLLLVFTIGSLRFRAGLVRVCPFLALILLSSIAAVHLLGMASDLPSRLQTASVWASIPIAIFVLAALATHWFKEAKRLDISFFRAFGCFSIVMSGIGLLALFVFPLPDAHLDQDGIVEVLYNALKWRSALFLFWVPYAVTLALPGASRRPISLGTIGQLQGGVLKNALRSMERFIYLAAGFFKNLGKELRDGFQDIARLSRAAMESVGRRIVLPGLAIMSLHIALCALVFAFLEYDTNRNVSLLELLAGGFVAVPSAILLIWGIAKSPLAEIARVVGDTLMMGSIITLSCGAIASCLWWGFEIISGANNGVNWVAASIVLVIIFFTLWQKKAKRHA